MGAVGATALIAVCVAAIIVLRRYGCKMLHPPALGPAMATSKDTDLVCTHAIQRLWTFSG
jgi:hypothetical protein